LRAALLTKKFNVSIGKAAVPIYLLLSNFDVKNVLAKMSKAYFLFRKHSTPISICPQKAISSNHPNHF